MGRLPSTCRRPPHLQSNTLWITGTIQSRIFKTSFTNSHSLDSNAHLHIDIKIGTLEQVYSSHEKYIYNELFLCDVAAAWWFQVQQRVQQGRTLYISLYSSPRPDSKQEHNTHTACVVLHVSPTLDGVFRPAGTAPHDCTMQCPVIKCHVLAKENVCYNVCLREIHKAYKTIKYCKLKDIHPIDIQIEKISILCLYLNCI